jgi:glycosyltransferase involved in cell wall biosynthesis
MQGARTLKSGCLQFCKTGYNLSEWCRNSGDGQEMNRLRVLLVVRWPLGGIRTHLKYVYPLLVQKLGGMHLSLLGPRMDEMERLKRDLAPLQVRFIELDNCTNVALARAVDHEIAGGDVDLVHSHGFTAACSAALPARLRRVPHLATIHDILQDSQFVGPKGIARRLCFRVLLNLVDIVHAVGDEAGENLVAHLGPGIGSRLRVIRNGILTEPVLHAAPRDLRTELGLQSGAFLVGYFGRFMAQKGFRYLVEAVRLLRDREGNQLHRPVHVVAFGADGFVREDRAALERAGLRSYFSFLPHVPEVASTLKAVDVVAIPSLWEAMPLLPMEAMVAGVPVVGTSCIGLGEVLVDSPSAVVSPRDAAALAGALEHEANSSSRAAAEGFVPRAVERFDVANQVSKLGDLISQMTTR